MLTSELGAGEKLRMIPGEQVVRMKVDLALADAEGFAHRHAGTDSHATSAPIWSCSGRMSPWPRTAGTQIRVDLRVQDAAGGETIASVTETGTESELLTLVSRMGSALRDKLGVGELSATQAAGMQGVAAVGSGRGTRLHRGARQPPACRRTSPRGTCS